MIPDINRLFFRQPERTKLYTKRYIDKLKRDYQKKIDKFILGAAGSLKKQKKAIMKVAHEMVISSHEKVTNAFQGEMIHLLDQK